MQKFEQLFPNTVFGHLKADALVQIPHILNRGIKEECVGSVPYSMHDAILDQHQPYFYLLPKVTYSTKRIFLLFKKMHIFSSHMYNQMVLHTR